MLKNYLIDADLKRYYPNLAKYLWTTQSDYSTQIDEAFALILDDLRARNLEPRRMMTPIDVIRAVNATGEQDILTRVTETASTTPSGYAEGIDGFNRFVVQAFASSAGPHTIKLQGSNDQGVSASAPPTNWEDIVSLSFTTPATKSITFDFQYKWYRRLSTIGGASPTIAYDASLVETSPDRWIIWRTLAMIFRDFSKQPNDSWDEKSREALANYEQALSAYKFTVDTNDDNLVSGADALDARTETRFTR